MDSPPFAILSDDEIARVIIKIREPLLEQETVIENLFEAHRKELMASLRFELAAVVREELSKDYRHMKMPDGDAGAGAAPRKPPAPAIEEQRDAVEPFSSLEHMDLGDNLRRDRQSVIQAHHEQMEKQASNQEGSVGDYSSRTSRLEKGKSTRALRMEKARSKVSRGRDSRKGATAHRNHDDSSDQEMPAAPAAPAAPDEGGGSGKGLPGRPLPRSDSMHSTAFKESWQGQMIAANPALRLKSELCQLPMHHHHEDEDADRIGRKSSLRELTYKLGNARWQVLFVLESNQFELFIACLILGNAILVGVETDWMIQNPKSETLLVFRLLEVFFVIFFGIELGMRIFVEQIAFLSYRNKDVGWNIFDFTLVNISLVEEIATLAGYSFTKLAFMRVLRLCRVIRVIRLMRFFTDIRTMVIGIINSMRSLMWAMLLLLFFMYICSISIMQMLITEPAIQVRNEEHGLVLHFGSLTRSVYTLFKAIVGGIDWGDPAELLLDVNVFLAMYFCFYVAFSVFCVLNIVTGVFVENTNRICQRDEEALIMSELDRRKEWFKNLCDIFKRLDGDSSGCVTLHELKERLSDVRLQAIFTKLQVEVHEANVDEFFDMLDFDDDGILDLHEFTFALQHLRGHATALDCASLKIKLDHLRRNLAELSKLVAKSVGGGSLPENAQFNERSSNRHNPRSRHTVLANADGGSGSSRSTAHEEFSNVVPAIPGTL